MAEVQKMQEQFSAWDVMYAGNARLHGCRRYDFMEGIGRVESGTETESNAGAVAEEQISVDPKRTFVHLHLNSKI